jgi:hypothetical protein
VLKHANSSSQGRVALLPEARRKFLEYAKGEKVVFVLWTAGRILALNKRQMQRAMEPRKQKKWVFVANTRYNYFPLMRRLGSALSYFFFFFLAAFFFVAIECLLESLLLRARFLTRVGSHS